MGRWGGSSWLEFGFGFGFGFGFRFGVGFGFGFGFGVWGLGCDKGVARRAQGPNRRALA